MEVLSLAVLKIVFSVAVLVTLESFLLVVRKMLWTLLELLVLGERRILKIPLSPLFEIVSH